MMNRNAGKGDFASGIETGRAIRLIGGTRLRQVELDAVSEEDLRQVTEALKQKAMDVAASSFVGQAFQPDAFWQSLALCVSQADR